MGGESNPTSREGRNEGRWKNNERVQEERAVVVRTYVWKWSVIAIGFGPRGRSLRSDGGGGSLLEKKPSAGGKSWFR